MHFYSKYFSGVHDKMDQKPKWTKTTKLWRNKEELWENQSLRRQATSNTTSRLFLFLQTPAHFKSKANTRRTSSLQLCNHTQAVLSGRAARWCSCYGPSSLRLLRTPLSYKELKSLFSVYKARVTRQKLQMKGKTHPTAISYGLRRSGGPGDCRCLHTWLT